MLIKYSNDANFLASLYTKMADLMLTLDINDGAKNCFANAAKSY